jgi:putative DNA primase/helicase
MPAVSDTDQLAIIAASDAPADEGIADTQGDPGFGGHASRDTADPPVGEAPGVTTTGTNGFTLADAPTETDEEFIHRLAKLPLLEYERVRETEAKARGSRVAILDKAVQAARGQHDAASGRGVALHDPDPWPEPVATDALLNHLVEAIRRHVVLSPAASDVVALWIAHTWAYQRFDYSPRLGITSPTKRCGKSTLMEVLRLTCCRTLKVDNISASGVFRTVEALRPLTLLADEADTFLRDAEELRGVLNSGFERSGQVIRIVERNGEHVPVMFGTFCPVALAAIGELPATLGDRAVPIRLERKAASEKVQKMRAAGNRAALSDLARKLTRWSADASSALATDPGLPEAMSDREGDNSVPLIAIAKHAGPEWAARGCKALLEMFGLRAAAEGNTEIGALLLGDIRALFGDADKMPSATLCKSLAEMEDRPWPEWRQNKPMTQTQLATALKPFRIRPTTIRDGDSTPKGYERKAFEEAWSRYLADANTPASTQEGDSEPQRRNIPGNSRDSAESRAATLVEALRTNESEDRSPELQCCGVAAETPLPKNHGEGIGRTQEVDGETEGVL